MMALRTDKQLVDEFNLPSTRTVRTMRQQGLPAVRLGKAYLYDPNDVQEFITKRKVSSCPGRTEDHTSNSSENEVVSTSTGARKAQPASDRRALRTVEKLKQLSPRLSKNAEAEGGPARVIPTNFRSQTH
jgi:hypothetical protein